MVALLAEHQLGKRGSVPHGEGSALEHGLGQHVRLVVEDGGREGLPELPGSVVPTPGKSEERLKGGCHETATPLSAGL